ncbi:MAG: Hint domain-containing protein, partial [Jannaschia sp.]
EAATACIAGGGILRRPGGAVAVEDLRPGDRVLTATGESVRIDWIGARLYRREGRRPTFFRISAGAFGNTGPKRTMTVGAAAHLLLEDRRCLPLVGTPRAFAPIAAFEDGETVLRIVPAGDVPVYGIACVTQAAVVVSGLSIETFHPAHAVAACAGEAFRADLARLIPLDFDGTGFAPARIPRLSLSEARTLVRPAD